MFEDVKAVARRFIEEQDRLRGGPSEQCCTDDYIAFLASFPPMDLKGHQGFTAGFYEAFPDLKHNIEAVVAEGDRVALRIRFTGTNTGRFGGKPPSGKPIEFNGLVLMRVASGKVAELHGQFDQMGVLQQLGMVAG